MAAVYGSLVHLVTDTPLDDRERHHPTEHPRPSKECLSVTTINTMTVVFAIFVLQLLT
jgi:hypothetical protein